MELLPSTVWSGSSSRAHQNLQDTIQAMQRPNHRGQAVQRTHVS
ncbi:hypothetical protein AOLI_G00286610, partial [Acnodon oligacanthus]